MAGSYKDCIGKGGKFTLAHISDIKDAHEACKEMYYIIQMLSGGDTLVIAAAIQNYYAEENPRNHQPVEIVQACVRNDTKQVEQRFLPSGFSSIKPDRKVSCRRSELAESTD